MKPLVLAASLLAGCVLPEERSVPECMKHCDPLPVASFQRYERCVCGISVQVNVSDSWKASTK